MTRDYKNYFKPKAGINIDNIESVREKASSSSEVQRYVVIVMNEMKIQSNLVFDKYSDDLSDLWISEIQWQIMLVWARKMSWQLMH